KGGFILAGNAGTGASRQAVLIAISGRGNLDPRWGTGGVANLQTTVGLIGVLVTPDGGAAAGFTGCPPRGACDRYGYLHFGHDGQLVAAPTLAPQGYGASGGQVVVDGSG